MNFISTKDAAEKWHIGLRRVQFMCANDMVPGAKLMGRQWVIPENAPRPTDGRTREGKDKVYQEVYHFPFLVHTSFCTQPDFLNDDERKLLEAQKLFYTCDYKKSIKFCREILNVTDNEAMKVGCYATMVYDSFVLGLTHEFFQALSNLRATINKASTHKEDYEIILAVIAYEATWNPRKIFNIDLRKLSPSASPFLMHSAMLCSAVEKKKESRNAILAYELNIIAAEAMSLIPTAINMHCTLAQILLNNNRPKEVDYHIKRACELSEDYGCILFLSRYYSMFPAEFDKHLSEISRSYARKVKEQSYTNIRNWKNVSSHVEEHRF